ncbi:hypothetical protein LPB90_18120 [Chryseobacterium sp. LC2016-29]|uniref:hypothetical protein n=1 Tax=Chryseobacterium sp. LC2016-29 TaxID=2897331 RepID=UPI001E4CF066|nr:hypothetical protein [Chryseobacterium sp. LC2016-29]MCD0480358.1 hypothetical protein [Chryseobacterium sp. LC2016-29]
MEIKNKKESSSSSFDEIRIIKNVVIGIITLGVLIICIQKIYRLMSELEKDITSKKYYELVLNNGQIVRDSMLYFNKRYIKDSIAYPEASIQSVKIIKNSKKNNMKSN